MKITQISLFLENRPARIKDVCHALGDAGINILGLTVAETEQFGVLRLIADEPERAVEALKAHNFVAALTDVVVVGVQDKPGGLAHVLDVIGGADINIEYMHAFLDRTDDLAYMIFRFDNPEEAVKVLMAAGIPILTKDKMRK